MTTKIDIQHALGVQEQIVERVRDWFRRSVVELRDRNMQPQIKIWLHSPQGDDDGTLYVEARVEERREHDLEGRVEGFSFERGTD